MSMPRLLLLVCLSCWVVSSLAQGSTTSFPDGFVWGVSTASYQVEGAWKADGRSLSIWDVFSHTPGKTYNNETGDVADEQYRLYPEDIKHMQNMGMKYYRMSLAWTRLLPGGFANSPVNNKAVEHYNNLINSLLTANIQPFVTIFHWDLPQILEEQGGWLNASLTDEFAGYADLCFKLFGDRVHNWLTINEPHTVAVNGYYDGSNAPGRCSNRSRCSAGNSSTEPYIVAHNLLIAHAKAVQIYRQKYQAAQGGVISLALDVEWGQPFDINVPDDVAAGNRYVEFWAGWFADPVFGSGNYPQSMIDNVGDRLPVLTPEEQALLRGSADFFAMNHYTSNYCSPPSSSWDPVPGYDQDMQVETSVEKNGVLIGPPAASSWLYVVPYGIRSALNWLHDRYGDLTFIITENGVDVPGEDMMTIPEARNDTFRIQYLHDYISQVQTAIDVDRINVRGYFCWSLLDNFEWADAYSKRFGLIYVDFNTQIRYPKDSAAWFSQLVKSNVIPPVSST